MVGGAVFLLAYFFIKKDVYIFVDLYTLCTYFCILVYILFTCCLQACGLVNKFVYKLLWQGVYRFVMNVYIFVYINVKFTYCLHFLLFYFFSIRPLKNLSISYSLIVDKTF